MPYTTPPRLRLQRLRVHRGRHRERAADVRRDRRAGEVHACSSCATARAGRAGCRSPAFFELVLGAHRAANAAARRHRGRSQDRRAVRAQRVQQRVRRARRVPRLQRGAAHGHRRPRSSSSAATAAPRDPACMTRARLSGRVGAGLDPCLAMQVMVELADGQEREIAFTFGSGRDLADARTSCTASAAPARRAPRSRASGRTGTARSARSTCRRPIASLNFLANGWLLYQVLACRHVGAQRLLPVGRRVRLPRPAAGRDGAGPRRARAPARADPALRRRASSARATCSTGGIRRSGAACARASPTTTCGCRTRSAATSPRSATPACSTRRSPFLEGRPVKPDEDSYYDLPARSDESATRLRALRARDQERPALRRARPAADGQRRLERRHEPRRRARQGRERVARVLPLRRARAASPRSRGAAATPRSPTRARPRRRGCARTSRSTRWDGEWYRRAYFDNGEPLGSATQPRVPDRLAAAELVGAVAAPAIPSASRQALAALDARLVERDLGVDPAVRSAVRHVRARSPATSRATCPACARTAASTPTPRSGRSMAFAAAGDVARAWELFGLINPVRHGDSAAGDRDLQGRAVRRRRRRLHQPAARRPRRLDLVHRLGGLDVPADHRVAARPAPRGRPPARRAASSRRWQGFEFTTATTRPSMS